MCDYLVDFAAFVSLYGCVLIIFGWFVWLSSLSICVLYSCRSYSAVYDLCFQYDRRNAACIIYIYVMVDGSKLVFRLYPPSSMWYVVRPHNLLQLANCGYV